MKTFTITPDAARAIVKSGFPKVVKRIQTIKAPPPAVEEPPFAKFKVSGAWTSSASGYRANAYMLDGNGEVCSGTMTVYAPFATTETAKDLPKGKIHAARVEGRWELIQGGGGGGDVDIYAGEGVRIDEPDYTITNTGVLSLTIANTYASFRGDVKLDNKYFTARDGMLSLNRIKGYGRVGVRQVSENEVEITFGVDVEFA